MTLTAQQLEIRKTGVGASEVAAVLGLDRYRTPFDVWAVKTGKTAERVSTASVGTPAERLGILLEPVVADLYAMAHPHWFCYSAETVRHPDHPFALATPDRIVSDHWDPDQVKSRHLLEIKTKSWRTARGFGAEGSDQLPETILCQVHWQMLVMRLTRADVAVLIDGREYREYTVHADADLQVSLLGQVEEFWTKHVLTDTPPAMKGNTVGEYLRQQFRLHDADVVPADQAGELALAQLVEARAATKAAEAHEEDVANTLKILIGHHKGIQGECGRATWSLTKDSERHDWKAVAQQYRNMLELRGVTGEELATVAAEHTTMVPGSRRFLFTPAKES